MPRTVYPTIRVTKTPNERRFDIVIDLGPNHRPGGPRAIGVATTHSKPLADSMATLLNLGAAIARGGRL